MEAVLASAGIELPADGRDGHRVSALDPRRRQEMVTQLMMQRNKVTHIYELVKAYGSTMQIRFNRQDKRWDRVEALVEKHAREYAVNLFDGVYGRGEGHAPMGLRGRPAPGRPVRASKTPDGDAARSRRDDREGLARRDRAGRRGRPRPGLRRCGAALVGRQGVEP
jgi:hypothetical protein